MAVSTTFSYTGAVQDFVVPENINIGGVGNGGNTLVVEAWGAQGGDGYYEDPGGDNNPVNRSGGLGGYIKVGALPTLTPGETLKVYVGGAGTDRLLSGATTNSYAGAGWNGGGDAAGANGYRGGGGGGASDVRQGGTALGNRVVVAAGGAGDGAGNVTGGSSSIVSEAGGMNRGMHGGANTGEDNAGLTQEAEGGTQSAGGARGVRLDELTGETVHSQNASTAGAAGTGGRGGSRDITYSGRRLWFSAGGAGGGYYGGGGGDIWNVVGGSGNPDMLGGHSGGGSNYTATSAITNSRGVRTGHGQVKFTYALDPVLDNLVGLDLVANDTEVRTSAPRFQADLLAHEDDEAGLTQWLAVQLCTEPTFKNAPVIEVTSPAYDATNTTVGAVASAGDISEHLENNRVYYWRARIVDSLGRDGALSTTESFEVIFENSWGGGFI